MAKKVLVTGATGFIGNYVIREALKTGYKVIATSTNKEKAKNFDWFKKVEYIPFDFDEFDQQIDYFDFFSKPDILIHLAWQGLPNYKENFHLEKNLPVQQSFLENMVKNGLSDLTVTGTCFEYGMKEGCLTETMACEPANAYAMAKNELRLGLEVLQSRYRFSCKWIRLFYMYGKGQGSKSLISQLEQALELGDTVFNMSGGEQMRDFLPVATVAERIVKIATQDVLTGIINCCSGEPVKLKSFVENYLKAKHKTIKLNLGYYPYTDYEAMSFWGDTNKMRGIIH